jgi:hypothetical protein
MRKFLFYSVLVIIFAYGLALGWALYHAGSQMTKMSCFSTALLFVGAWGLLFQYLFREKTKRIEIAIALGAFASILGFVGVVGVSTMSFIGEVVLQNGQAQLGTTYMAPWSVEQTYNYPTEYYLNATEYIKGQPVQLRLYTQREYDDQLFYYQEYGTPEAVEDSLRQAAKDALHLVEVTEPVLQTSREVLAAACASVRPLQGYAHLLIVLRSDSTVFKTANK